MKNIIIILLFILLICKPIFGFTQVSKLEIDSMKYNKTMIDFYGGICNMNLSKFDKITGFGVSFGIDFSRIKNNHIEKFRLSHSVNILFMSNDHETISELGGLYGLFNKNGHMYSEISAGIGIVGGKKRGKYLGSSGGGIWSFGDPNYENDNYISIGIPFDAKIMYLGKNGGFGLKLSGNINSKISYYGLNIVGCLII
jgi:hypothetical protein